MRQGWGLRNNLTPISCPAVAFPAVRVLVSLVVSVVFCRLSLGTAALDAWCVVSG